MPASARKCRIVVADDHPDTAQSLGLLIEISGHEAFVYTDAVEAMAAIEARRPDIVFLDIGMPTMSGWALAERLRLKYPPEELKLVAITAYGDDASRARSRAAGFDAHLVKPVDMAIVEQIIHHFTQDLPRRR